MAIRYREGRKSPWCVYWNNPHTGKRESLNFATEAEAKKENSLVKHRLVHERESFTKEVLSHENKYTLEVVYLQYLKAKQFSKKSLTWQMDCMKTPLQMLGAIEITAITKKDIERVMNAMSLKNVKPVTVRGRMSVFRTVMRWAAEKEYCPPVVFPKLPPAHYEKFVPPTTEEIHAMLDAAPPHIQRVIILGSQMGMRIGQSELLRLTWADVDLQQMYVRVHGAKKNASQPWRLVPIRSELLHIFETWRAEDGSQGYLVHYKGKRINKIQTAWENMLKRAGIERRIRPYDLRHAFATEAIAAGADVGTVAKLMGHSSPQMVLKHYQHVLDSRKRAVMDTLPKLNFVKEVELWQ